MKTVIDKKTIKTITKCKTITADAIFSFVKKTGYNELYCGTYNYFTFVDAIASSGYNMIQGLTDDGFSFISFIGIRIIMIPKDKMDKYQLLK